MNLRSLNIGVCIYREIKANRSVTVTMKGAAISLIGHYICNIHPNAVVQRPSMCTQRTNVAP